MARADLLVNLVRAGISGDKASFRDVVEALAAEERSKRHEGLADRLTKALNGASHFSLFNADAAAPQGTSGRDFLTERVPELNLGSLVLPMHVQESLSDLIEENHRADLLRSYGLQPRHRILLAGPPGNGKTSVAEGLAESLSRPLLTVRYDALIGSYLGETNQRLRQLFDYVKTRACVLFFDEFDAIGKERGDRQETGEIKRVVSSLLMEIDSLPSYVMVVAATNHEELLDRAVWRRFQLKLPLPSPTPDEVSEFFYRVFEVPKNQWAAVLRELRKVGIDNYAEAADFVIDVRRRSVLSGGATPVQDVIRERANHWARRIRAPNVGDGSHETSFEDEHTTARRSR
ncbi:Proteasome-associated ATPase [compost metagenome]